MDIKEVRKLLDAELASRTSQDMRISPTSETQRGF